jgi:hypothetical protein
MTLSEKTKTDEPTVVSPGEEFVDGTGRYDRAARRVADQRSHGAPDALDGDGLRYPEVDDIARATYPDPKVAHLKGESPMLQLKRELAEHDRGAPEGEPRDLENPVTRLPDGTPAGNAEAVAHNEAKHEEAFETLGTGHQARISREGDLASTDEGLDDPEGVKARGNANTQRATKAEKVDEKADAKAEKGKS